MDLTENVVDVPLLSIDCDEIQKLIPHRYPFLFVDRIENMRLGESATGIKNVSMNEWYFQGHFPEKPIMPGVLIVEAMGQTAAALGVKTFQSPETPLIYFMSVNEVKFRHPVVPGDCLRLHVQKIHRRGSVWKFRGEAWVGKTLVSEAFLTAMLSHP